MKYLLVVLVLLLGACVSGEHYEVVKVYLDEIEMNNNRLDELREKESLTRVDSLAIEHLISENERLAVLANERSQFWKNQNRGRLVPNEYGENESDSDVEFR
jgi:primosomal protein N''